MARDWKDPPVVGRPCEEYLVRRLTPDECCRLQGYPDGWCKDLESEDPDEDEILFWTEVFREWDVRSGELKTGKKPACFLSNLLEISKDDG